MKCLGFPYFFALFLLVISQTVAASQEGAQSFTFDGRAFADSAATLPLLDTISLKIQILNQAQDCVIYEESQTVNTTTTNGYFTIQMGSVLGSPKRTAGDSTHSMSAVFSNTIASLSGKLLSNGSACTYSPVNAQVRYFRLQMTPAIDGVLRTITPNMALDAVPNAMVAERAENLQGFYPTDLILVNNTAPATLNQANLESVFSTTNFPRLTSLLSVAPSNYVQTGANGSALLPVVAGNPGSGLASGQIWYDSSANVLKYYDGAVKTIGTSGGSTGPIVDNTNAATTAIAVTQSGSGYAGTFMGGNVGIGTASPASKLTVTDLGGTMSFSSATNGPAILSLQNTNAAAAWSLYQGFTTYNDLSFFQGGSLKAHMTGGGFLIGSSGNNPTSMLDVYGNAAIGAGYAGVSAAPTNGLIVQGNVGIGTAAPAAVMDVAGEVKIGSTSVACSAANKGSIRYNNVSSILEFCNGSAWNILQAAACTNPNPNVFTFADQANATASALNTSDIVLISGINCSVPVTISGSGSPQYQICSDAGCSTVLQAWTSSPSSIMTGQYVQARLTADSVGGSAFKATMIIGSGATVWTVTTAGGDCTASPSVGTVCADGSIYAGLSPDGNVKMFTQRCDMGQTWDGVNCTGTRNQYSWNNGTGNLISTGMTSSITGKSNTATLAALGDAASPYLAARTCTTLNQNGRVDWYLPSSMEVNVLFSGKAAIKNFQTAGFQNYWSSSEFDANGANYYDMAGGNILQALKNNGGVYIRCVRR